MDTITRFVNELKVSLNVLDIENEYRRYGTPNDLRNSIKKAEKIILRLKEIVKDTEPQRL